MAAPVLEKTWEISPNNIVPSQAFTPFNEECMFLIKTRFIGFTNNPWTVAGSSDSSTAGMDAADRWITQANIVWSTGSHSWIVLERVDGAQLLLNMDIGNQGQIHGYWSPSANFTGGSITARPTAVDEIDCVTALNSPSYWNGNQISGTPVRQIYHFYHSTDGLITRVNICASGNWFSSWRFETIKNARAAHTNNPTIACIHSPSGLAGMIVSNWEDTGYLRSEKDGTGIQIHIKSMGMGHQGQNLTEKTEANGAEEWDNELWVTEEHLWCEDVGARGPKGQAYDIWWGQYQVWANGDTFPDSVVARDFMALIPFVFPWTGDATIPLIA